LVQRIGHAIIPGTLAGFQGDSSQGSLHDLFVADNGIASVDLRTTCLGWSWDQYKGRLAKGLLTELCALYERWLEDVVPRSTPRQHVKKVVKALQYPTSLARERGFRAAIAIVNEHQSQLGFYQETLKSRTR